MIIFKEDEKSFCRKICPCFCPSKDIGEDELIDDTQKNISELMEPNQLATTSNHDIPDLIMEEDKLVTQSNDNIEIYIPESNMELVEQSNDNIEIVTKMELVDGRSNDHIKINNLEKVN
jgi:hypothetical protein